MPGQDYPQLSSESQLLLIAVATTEPTSGPYGMPLGRCRQIAELSESALAAVSDEISTHKLGGVRIIENVGAVVVLSDLGRATVKQLAVVAPGGTVQELSTNLSKEQRAILDAVVTSHLRNRNPPATSQVRTLTRRAFDPQLTIDAVSRELEPLIRDHLIAGAGVDPPLWPKLRGILDSSWGRNALDLLEHVFGVIGEEDPGAPQFSFGMLLKHGVSPRLFELARLVIPLAKLSPGGPYDHDGDQWWPMPPERDVLLERGSALPHLKATLGAEPTPPTPTPSSSHSKIAERFSFPIDPSWSFTTFLGKLFAYHRGSSDQSARARLAALRAWFSMAGRTAALAAIQAFELDARESTEAEIAESIWMSESSYRELKEWVAWLPEDTRVGSDRPPKVFLSYKWESDKHGEWVCKFAQDLRTNGINAVLDRWEVRLGESFTDYMQQHINDSDVILFIITPEAVAAAEAPNGEGGALKFEVQMMNARRIAEGTRIIGVYRSGNRPPHYLRDHRYADFREDANYSLSLSVLVDDLLGRGGPPTLGGRREVPPSSDR